MDIHKKIVGWLAIIRGTLSILVLLFLFLILGGTAMFLQDRQSSQIIALVATFIFAFFGVLGGADIILGICFLRGSKVAEILLIISSFLFLFAFPLGTVIGVYSLWALLRKQPPLPGQHQSLIIEV